MASYDYMHHAVSLRAPAPDFLCPMTINNVDANGNIIKSGVIGVCSPFAINDCKPVFCCGPDYLENFCDPNGCANQSYSFGLVDSAGIPVPTCPGNSGCPFVDNWLNEAICLDEADPPLAFPGKMIQTYIPLTAPGGSPGNVGDILEIGCFSGCTGEIYNFHFPGDGEGREWHLCLDPHGSSSKICKTIQDTCL